MTYSFARAAGYRKLFDDVFEFTRELVHESADAGATQVRQRARYWAALALLRCVMSSPVAAEKALRVRAAGETGLELEADAATSDNLFSGYVANPTKDQEHVQDL